MFSNSFSHDFSKHFLLPLHLQNSLDRVQRNRKITKKKSWEKIKNAKIRLNTLNHVFLRNLKRNIVHISYYTSSLKKKRQTQKKLLWRSVKNLLLSDIFSISIKANKKPFRVFLRFIYSILKIKYDNVSAGLRVNIFSYIKNISTCLLMLQANALIFPLNSP